MASRRCPSLSHALRVLDAIAPVSLAAKWDNVGLLVDATRHHTPTATTAAVDAVDRSAGSYKVFFTNDLTPQVLDEAVSQKPNLIVTYHPTPFSSMKTFKLENTAAKVVLTCAANGIAVYSPHTALDAVPGGINDWLIDVIAGLLLTSSPAFAIDKLERRAVKKSDDVEAALKGAGDGRIAVLPAPARLSDVVAAVKAGLGLDHVQLALPSEHLAVLNGGSAAVLTEAENISVTSFAVCAGSGASVLAGSKADVFITGEMSHHEVLAANNSGSAVILTHHSKCERGYLKLLVDKFLQSWQEIRRTSDEGVMLDVQPQVYISAIDADPLVIV